MSPNRLLFTGLLTPERAWALAWEGMIEGQVPTGSDDRALPWLAWLAAGGVELVRPTENPDWWLRQDRGPLPATAILGLAPLPGVFLPHPEREAPKDRPVLLLDAEGHPWSCLWFPVGPADLQAPGSPWAAWPHEYEPLGWAPLVTPQLPAQGPAAVDPPARPAEGGAPDPSSGAPTSEPLPGCGCSTVLFVGPLEGEP
ncbi:MAG TPA: hypothetical protein VF017_15365 [Thermoanaerobaculia bacterium]|nr:hypothetical protein [Thermoanaerobaculia bacterium]